MKLLELTKVEQQTLREMGILHEHYRTRMRAQAILRLSQGLTLQQTADEFMVHINSIEQWRQRWNRLGLVGLYEGRHTGGPTTSVLETGTSSRGNQFSLGKEGIRAKYSPDDSLCLVRKIAKMDAVAKRCFTTCRIHLNV